MKKVFALMTVVIFASFLMTSCGGDKDKKDGDKDKKESATSDSDSEDAEDLGTSDGEKTSSCDEALAKYEEFATNFEILQKKAKANPNDLSILEETGKMFKDMGDWQEKLGDCASNPAYADRITKINERINKAAEIK